ncbi:MAG: hypothetical protein E7379_01075 [Clostridiales bacterium]|nr:hypothetical protein [Clostridiales bacterium]
MDIEFEIAKNQIAIDFENLKDQDGQEESLVLQKSVIKPVNFDWIKNEVLFVVVKANRIEVCPGFSSLKLCGKTMTDWVLMASGGCQTMVVNDCEDIIDKIRTINTDKKIIALFYSDTPLLDKSGFYRIMDYFSSKSINFLQLARGIIVKTGFLKNNPSFMSSATGGYEDDCLFVVDSGQALSYAHKQLNQKVLNFHKANGVVIFGENSVFVDADCEIDSGVIIYPNNVISGQSIISSGCVLQSGNVVVDSILAENVEIQGCYIENSKICQGNVVKAGEKVINEER